MRPVHILMHYWDYNSSQLCNVGGQYVGAGDWKFSQKHGELCNRANVGSGYHWRWQVSNEVVECY